MRKQLIVLLVIGLVGCASAKTKLVESINTAFEGINISDGVSEDEAVIIGNQSLFKHNVLDLYNTEAPEINKSEYSNLVDFNRYWFVSYYELETSAIPYEYLVLIDKESGKVLYSDDFPQGENFILESKLLRLREKRIFK